MPESTPPFLLWTLARSCSLREINHWTSPQQTERHLRAAQVTSDAFTEGLVKEGLAIRGQEGFRIAETVALYGGLDALRQTCAPCPANIHSSDSEITTFAGCFGMVPLPSDITPLAQCLHDAFLIAVNDSAAATNWQTDLPSTKPLFHAFWMREIIPTSIVYPLSKALHQSLAHFPMPQHTSRPEALLFANALAASHTHQIPLHVQYFPAGERTPTHWTLPATCPHCHTAWQSHAPGICPICNFQGHPLPPQVRRARGQRPYFPLTRLLRDTSSS